MVIRGVLAVALLAATLLGGLAHAGSDPAAATPPAPSAQGTGDLSLVLSIRALAVGVAPFPAAVDADPVKASTGEGTTRWPTGEIAKGVYISVMPACIPGVDEPLVPSRRLPAARRR
jgi:hypothetical protein